MSALTVPVRRVWPSVPGNRGSSVTTAAPTALRYRPGGRRPAPPLPPGPP
jgi:hypothetical protein